MLRRSAKNMHVYPIIILVISLTVTPLFATLPEIAKFKEGDSLVIHVNHRKPKQIEYTYMFTDKTVFISSRVGSKVSNLGQVNYTILKLEEVDRFLDLVTRGKKTGHNQVDGVLYQFTINRSGQKSKFVRFDISEPRISKLRLITLRDLRARAIVK